MHYTDTSSNLAFTQGQLDTIVATMRSAFKDRLLIRLGAAVTLTSVTAVDLTSNAGLTSVLSVADPGSVAAPYMPANAAACLSWHDPIHYRGGHPRTYLTGIPASAQATVRQFTNTFLTNMQSSINLFLADVNVTLSGRSMKLACVHRTRNNVTLNPVVVSFLTTGSVDARIDTQRRRLGPDL
jgi:hypothetical protein